MFDHGAVQIRLAPGTATVVVVLQRRHQAIRHIGEFCLRRLPCLKLFPQPTQLAVLVVRQQPEDTFGGCKNGFCGGAVISPVAVTNTKIGWTAGGGQYISVRDNGPGIPEDEIPVVLSAFGQGSTASKSAEQGTGLGLPIVQGLVAMHDGEFELRSKMREGTEAIAIFPRARVMENLPAVPAASRARGKIAHPGGMRADAPRAGAQRAKTRAADAAARGLSSAMVVTAFARRRRRRKRWQGIRRRCRFPG